ncbi:MAG: excinuclease ABC subunit UvrC [Candidatus Kapabacteria bacterium]|jgi:excinuclease ABC subunit C|nr:excinuclease ABC subunit UvrC [Candidatus Kapabacteria bacterium]
MNTDQSANTLESIANEAAEMLVPTATLAEKLHNIPTNPGVYLHKDENGKILYVGKAKSLRSRVRSYFQQGRPRDAKTRVLVSKIRDVEVILTDSEVEALILENTLIKEHQPRYNILLKDDKTYPYICITSEAFPRIFPTRKIVRDGSKYFGPYTEAKQMYVMLNLLKSLFPIRSCDLPLTEDAIVKKKFKVCLDYQIKKCEGPCEAFVSREHYNSMIKQSAQILRGKSRGVEHDLEREMERLSEEMEFEKAAVVRNRLAALREYSSKQKVLSTEPIDRDVLAIARNEKDACSVILKVRDGKLIGKQHFYIAQSEDTTEAAIVRATCERFYLESDDVPEEIFLPTEFEEIETLETWLATKRGAKVRVQIPTPNSEKRKLVNMAATNADFLLKELIIQRMKREQEKDKVIPRAVLSLQRDLRLSKPPRRIECFDNSHFQGSETVSSMVVFVDGKPKKSEYRKYKIKTVEGIDDFKSMQEVVGRRYKRMLEEKTEEPDLIIIDGGKGQLSHAVEVLQELGLYGKIPIIGLAKRLEEVVLPFQSDTILLPKTSSSLKLLQQARDEAHRFAIEFHRSLRDKRTLQTELTEIEGIGEKTAQKLLVTFGSVEGVRTASDEALEKTVGAKALQRLREHFVQEAGSSEE